MAFSYYKQLTIQTGQVPSSQSGFPALLPFLGGDTDIKNHARSDGFDIRPYSDSGLSSALTFELVWYDSSTGAFEMWVNMTAVDGGIIYLAYGDVGLSSDGSSSSTWDTNYRGVAHMGTSAITSTLDSKNGGLGRTSSSPVAGKIGGGVSIGAGGYLLWDSFSPSTETITIAGSTDKTISFWIKTSNFLAAADLFFNNVGAEVFQIYSGDNHLYWDDGGSGNGRISADFTSYFGIWAYVTLVSKGDNSFGAIYINGVQLVTRSVGQAPSSTLSALITPYAPSASFLWDEYRLSQIVRSSNWITAEYNNQNAPTSFWSTGAETSPGGGTTNGTLASTPTATCAFVGSSTASSAFASAPSATCAWIGASFFSAPWKGGQGFPNGVTNVFWLNCIAYFIVPLVSAPLADCEFIGASTASSVWASTPSATCSFVNISSGTLNFHPSAFCLFGGLVQDQGILASIPSAACSFTSIGYSIGSLAATPSATCSFVGAEVTDINTYLRRYLNDQVSMSVTGPAEDLDTSTEDDDTVYIRRYLNDKV